MHAMQNTLYARRGDTRTIYPMPGPSERMLTDLFESYTWPLLSVTDMREGGLAQEDGEEAVVLA